MAESPEERPLVLTEEELQRHVNRLTQRPAPQPIHDPFPVCPAPKLSQAEIDRIVERVYYEYVKRHEAALRDAEERREKEYGLVSTVLPSEEVEAGVKRWYYEALERREASRKDAEERLLFKSKANVPTIPLKRFVEDMYAKGMQRQKDKEQLLYEKYIVATEIKTTRISRSEAEASATRLSSKGGA
ncbi:uncharacterized protein TM35_000024080 [Trypanosoma theileri]|uniref:Uncharacterized protein n=1 Tax=Trypanosoma theileri TaxID=67003 RepID=A0A1X0P828_9TRYP|nr:uncharacterized protein TM35_000024080 [Trypanosoma theileri]ORC93082.1 hypothetical protein TM35_000024080 [Trypanosoma theileri]